VANKPAFLLSSSIAICAFASLAAISNSPNVGASDQGGRDLLLRAWGSGPLGAGSVRIPIPSDDATYEVIIKRPGVPQLIHVERSNAD
jgi:hypothetical protein